MPRPPANLVDEFYYKYFLEEAEADIPRGPDAKALYLFTWSPNPRIFHCRDPRKQYKQLLMNFITKFVKCFSIFALTPELTVNGNIHIHGWFMLSDPIKWFRNWLPKLGARNTGNMKVSKWNGGDAFYYYKKSVEEMNDIINYGDVEELPIPLTHHNVDAYEFKVIKTKYQTLLNDINKKKKSKNLNVYDWIIANATIDKEIIGYNSE